MVIINKLALAPLCVRAVYNYQNSAIKCKIIFGW